MYHYFQQIIAYNQHINVQIKQCINVVHKTCNIDNNCYNYMSCILVDEQLTFELRYQAKRSHQQIKYVNT